MDFIPNLLYQNILNTYTSKWTSYLTFYICLHNNYHSYCESYAQSDDTVPCRLLLHGWSCDMYM